MAVEMDIELTVKRLHKRQTNRANYIITISYHIINIILTIIMLKYKFWSVANSRSHLSGHRVVYICIYIDVTNVYCVFMYKTFTPKTRWRDRD